MDTIIGRSKEIARITELLESDKSEFMAIYGRRRIGKTFLIRNMFKNRFTFEVTAMADSSLHQNLLLFHEQIVKYFPIETRLPIPNNWFEAFENLKKLIEISNDNKKVIFIDELPWFDTKRSHFIGALENFWNGWGASRNDILFIICGSSTSWITNKIINGKGGLHNRLTATMRILPFDLSDCEKYLESRNIAWDRYQILEAYMVFGGIPYYWSLFSKEKSIAQNIDMLLFSQDAYLRSEFDRLYKSLFSNPERYIEVIKCLSSSTVGLTRKEILEKTDKSSGEGITMVLSNLCECGFISKRNLFTSKLPVYKLEDFYTIFYFIFLENYDYEDSFYWMSRIESPTHRTWCGLAFERVCRAHLPQIKSKLGISGIKTSAYSVTATYSGKKAQIDLLIDRSDHTMNLCEIKYSQAPFEITKSYSEILRNKVALINSVSNTRKAIHLTMVTTYGIVNNMYSGMIQNEVTMDDLFK